MTWTSCSASPSALRCSSPVASWSRARRRKSPKIRGCAKSTWGKPSMPELLGMDDVSAGYGDAIALERVSLALDEGDSLALLGRNGVGKTTLLITLMGLTRMRGGSLRWRGGSLSNMRTHERARAGIGWVPQERGMFPSLTVEEHLTSVARPSGKWDLARVYQTR